MQWSVYEGLGRTAIAAKKPAEAERHFQTTLDIIERTRSDLLKADYRLSFLTRLLGFYQRYIDSARRSSVTANRALAIADSSRGRVLGGTAERERAHARDSSRSPADRRATRCGAAVLLDRRPLVRRGRSRRIAFVSCRCPVTASQVDALVKSYQQSIVTSLADPLNSASSPGDEIYAKLIAPVADGMPAGVARRHRAGRRADAHQLRVAASAWSEAALLDRGRRSRGRAVARHAECAGAAARPEAE